MSRSRIERLLFELDQVRRELRTEAKYIDDIDWAPTPDMKSYRALLLEVGAMQAETFVMLSERRIPEWSESESLVAGDTVSDKLSSLDTTLEKIKMVLMATKDDALEATVTVPHEWVASFGAREVEIEEFVRWVARHEYYHLGQIVSYNWIRGINPYKHPAEAKV
jgi:hypothetical protein